MFRFIHLKNRNAHIAYLGGLAIDPSFSGKGYSIAMVKEIILLEKTKDLLWIELCTAVSNTRAITIYKKSGFEKEGVLIKYTNLKSENRFVDEVMMANLY